MSSIIKKTVVLLIVLMTSACATSHQVRSKSSVVNYLFPNNKNVSAEPETGSISLPARIGIAFVPEQGVRAKRSWLRHERISARAITEAQKYALLRTVEERFSDRDFIEKIEIIPSAYLTDGGSFANLEQIGGMFGVDLIALVSYDQVQFTDEGFLSLAYWTIVGAYLISGEKNDTQTLMDTVVYDIHSKTLLLRAPGSSRVQGRSTPVNLSEELRDDSNSGFALASVDMANNLDRELERFKTRLRKKTTNVSVSYRSGYSGGGSFGLVSTFGLLCLLMLKMRKHVV